MEEWGDRMLVDVSRTGVSAREESWEVGIDMVRTGERIKLLCEKKGLTVKDLQRDLRMGSFQSIYAWFSGRCLPNLDNMYRLSRILGVSMDDIIVGQGKRLGSEVEVLYLDMDFNVCRMEQYCKKVSRRWNDKKGCEI